MIDTKILREIPVFASLADPELAAVAKIAQVKRLGKGEMLFESGQNRTTFYVLLSGQAHIYRIFNDELQTLAILDRYNFAVESALSDPSQKHDHNGEMSGPGDVLAIEGKDFLKLTKDYPQVTLRIYANIISNLTRRLHHANNKLVTIYSTGKIASVYSDLDHLSVLILDTILKVIIAKKALFALFHPEEGQITIQEARGYGNNQQVRNMKIDLFKDPIFGQVYQAHQPVVVTSERYKKQKSLHTEYASPTMLAVPLQTGAKVIGAILLGDKANGEDFSYNNQLLLDIIARQITAAVAMAQTTEKDVPVM
ncbi:MAG: cyclic nucleotide-binding domain-containing protein [Patescibacteria group bacterium]|jgi:CRP-like cAMP-binding protein